MKNWKNSVYALFAMMCVLIFAGCQPMSDGTKPTGTVPGNTGGNDLNAVEKAIVGSFKLPDGIVFKFNSDRTGTKTTPASGNIRAAQPVLNFTWKADTSGNVSITFKDGSASPVVKFDMSRPNEITIDGVTATRESSANLNEYERKLMGTWYYREATIVYNSDKTFNWVVDFSGNGSYIITATGPWGATSDILTFNWDEVALNGKRLSEQEKEDLVRQYFRTTILSFKYEWHDNENINIINNYDTLLSRKPHYVVSYSYSRVGTVKTEYVEIGKDYNINFDYGRNVFVHAGVPQKYWKSGDWSFEKYVTSIGGNKREYRPGDSAKIESPTAYASYLLSIEGTDTRAEVIIGYKTKAVPKGSGYIDYGDTYWFYDGTSYTKRNETWSTGSGGGGPGYTPTPRRHTAKAGDIMSIGLPPVSTYKCIGFVDSSLNSISTNDIYERADPAIAWSESAPIELVPVFAAQ